MTLGGASGRTAEDFREVVKRMLLVADRGASIVRFLEDVTRILLATSRSGEVAVHLEEWTPSVRSRATRTAAGVFRFGTERILGDRRSPEAPLCPHEAIDRAILRGPMETPIPPFTARGGLWSPDAPSDSPISVDGEWIDLPAWARSSGFRSLMLLPLRVDGRPYGLVRLTHADAGRFSPEDVSFLEDLAEALGIALTHHRVQWALRERVKELTCLYGIAKLAGRHDLPFPDILGEIVRILPPGWQVPEQCAARIQLDEAEYATPDFVETTQRQAAEVIVDGRVRGVVEIVYLSPQPEMHEGPFLIEERNLINEVARQIALLVDRRRAEEEGAQLREQLLHADRLATLGKLTAGVAHELNEPIGSILGFAQLARGARELPEQAGRDLDKIVRAALHVREIIKKLMFFGRQTPPGMAAVDLKAIVGEALDLIDSRLAGRRIRVLRELAADLPRINADQGQILQVLVNLMVNAIQAMPDGGDLRITAERAGGFVQIAVEDTGIGMTEDVVRQVFVPFFTTKDVGQGTGLGLSVAHGIVTAHGGTIVAESEVGRGSRLVVRLPAAGVDNDRF